MSSSAPGPRPRQVTVGGWVVAIASVVLVVTVFDTMANLHSVDTRDKLTKALTTGSLKDLGISVADAITVIRAGLFVAGVAAAVTGILGIFVLQRHASARLVLTAAAVPVVLTAPVAGGFLAVMIGAATGLLWTRPARDWFAGRPVTQPESVSRESGWRSPPAAQPPPPLAPPSSSPPSSASPPPPPPPMPGWGQQPSGPAVRTAPPGPAYPPVPWPQQRLAPVPVRVACVLTWVFSLLTAGLYVLLVAVIAVDRGEVLDRLRDNATIRDSSLSDSELIGVLVAMSALVILWCLAASLLALLTWRRHAWAWVLLLVSVGAASFVALVGFPYALPNLAACVTAFVLLLRPSVRAWFRQPGGPGASPPPAPSWPPPTPQPPGKPPVW